MEGKLYYSISEVSSITGIKPYILRYWEREFPELKPKKFTSGKRRYKKKDIETILFIKKLLYEENYRIEGAKLKIRGDRDLTSKKSSDDASELKAGTEGIRVLIEEIKTEVEEILDILSKD